MFYDNTRLNDYYNGWFHAKNTKNYTIYIEYTDYAGTSKYSHPIADVDDKMIYEIDKHQDEISIYIEDNETKLKSNRLTMEKCGENTWKFI